MLIEAFVNLKEQSELIENGKIRLQMKTNLFCLVDSIRFDAKERWVEEK